MFPPTPGQIFNQDVREGFRCTWTAAAIQPQRGWGCPSETTGREDLPNGWDQEDTSSASWWQRRNGKIPQRSSSPEQEQVLAPVEHPQAALNSHSAH